MIWRPALGLVLLSSIGPELFSGNTPLQAWAQPQTLPLFILGYGLPILCLREAAVRCGTGVLGLIVAGLGYGLVNEGLYARTILRDTGLPIPLFDHYGQAMGLSWAWAVMICTWHAVTSVWLPIALIGARSAPGPWLGRGALVACALPAALAPPLVFRLTDTEGPRDGLMALLCLAILGLVALGLALRAAPPRAERRRRDGRAVLVGLAGVLAIVPPLMAIPHVPPLAYAALALGALAVWLRLALAQADPGWLAWGWFVQVAALGALAVAGQSPQTALADLALLSGLALWLRRRA